MRLAMTAFLTVLDEGKKNPGDYLGYRVHFESNHPFVHELMFKDPEIRKLQDSSFLVANPYSPDYSVRGMVAFLAETLRSYNPGNRKKPRLRIYRVRHAKDWNDKGRYVHHLYFEVITGMPEAVLCGGLNDHTGARYATKQLEDIFKLVSMMYDLTLEEVVVQPERCDEVEKRFRDTYDKYRGKQTSAAA